MKLLRLSVTREHAPDILHLSADVFYPNMMAARDFLGLALLVIILETHCCQAVKLNCRVVLGAPTRIVLPSPRQSEGLLLLLFSCPRALSSTPGNQGWILLNVGRTHREANLKVSPII